MNDELRAYNEAKQHQADAERSVRAEINAMRTAYEALCGLPIPDQNRALRWLQERITADQQKQATESAGLPEPPW